MPGEMNAMEIRFGRPIVSSDGERVGSVDGLVLDRTSRVVRQIRLLHGTDERSIPYQSVVSIDPDGIIDVNLTAFEVQQSSLESGVRGAGQNFMPYTSWVTGESMTSNFSPNVPTPDAYQSTETSPPDPNSIQIDAENVVAGPDGKVVGTIAGVEADENGMILELVIGTGFLRPDLRVDMETVEYVEGSYVSQTL